jgi:hypothetical protein
VVISGDLTLSIADVDLVRISLRVLIASVSGQDVLRPPGPDDIPADLLGDLPADLPDDRLEPPRYD